MLEPHAGREQQARRDLQRDLGERRGVAGVEDEVERARRRFVEHEVAPVATAGAHPCRPARRAAEPRGQREGTPPDRRAVHQTRLEPGIAIRVAIDATRIAARVGDGRAGDDAETVALAVEPEGRDGQVRRGPEPVLEGHLRHRPRRPEPVARPRALPGIGGELRFGESPRLSQHVIHARDRGAERGAIGQGEVGAQRAGALTELAETAPAVALPAVEERIPVETTGLPPGADMGRVQPAGAPPLGDVDGERGIGAASPHDVVEHPAELRPVLQRRGAADELDPVDGFERGGVVRLGIAERVGGDVGAVLPGVELPRPIGGQPADRDARLHPRHVLLPDHDAGRAGKRLAGVVEGRRSAQRRVDDLRAASDPRAGGIDGPEGRKFAEAGRGNPDGREAVAPVGGGIRLLREGGGWDREPDRGGQYPEREREAGPAGDFVHGSVR
ncbi:MAG: hypothetical protein MUF53_01150 [Gemmatimonadaceae bacterium]|nr:hypothetical protein [Gemmatimonadaceae bacterium]